MKDNNGKIAIAIVAMFVVALSIVGVTYAYFTASVVNNKNNESVKVTAGTMIINYDMGAKITANNIVPGWKNDGKMFYDPKYSVTVEDGISKISAVSTADFETGGKFAGQTPTVSTEVNGNGGLRAPVTFSVTNKGTRDSYYSVGLKDMANLLVGTDKANLEYSVYAAKNVAVNADGEPLEALEDADYVLETTLTDVPFGNAEANGTATLYNSVTLAPNKGNFYKIIFHYKEATTDQTDSSKLTKAFEATVVVDGIGETVENAENTVAETTTTVAAG